METSVAYKIIQPTTQSDTTPIGRHGAVIPGVPNSVIQFPETTNGTVSLGQSMFASGIITMSPVTGNGSGSVSVSGLSGTDVVLTSISTDASGSSKFFVNVNATADTISFKGLELSGSSFGHCHYVVYRTV